MFEQNEKKQIFRDAAIARLSSPEQLDQLMEVTDTKAWVGLAAIGVILLAALTWSVFGTIPTTVQGQGMLLKQGGLYDIQTQSGGRVRALRVREDRPVEEGGLIVEIAQPELMRQISQKQEQLQELLDSRDAERSRQSSGLSAQISAFDQQKKVAETQMTSAQDQITWLQQRLVAQEEAAGLGLISRDQVERSRQELAQLQGAIASGRAQLEQIQANTVTARHGAETATLTLDRQISAAESEISLLKGQLQQTGQVVSPYAGRVMEVLVDEGQLLAPGTKIATVELADSTLGAVIFVPGASQRPQTGMTARILPTNVHWEEAGFLEGTITYVSQTPVSMGGALRYVKNEALAQAMLSGGNPYAVEVRFRRDPTTPSGYTWTSGGGPDLQITSGMLATAQIDVERQRPISLVIPALRRLLGI